MTKQPHIALPLLLVSMLCISIFLTLMIKVHKVGLDNYILVTDFTAFYTAGQLIAHHEQDNFYHFPTQHYWQQKYFPRMDRLEKLNPFRNFAFIALLFLPLTYFPIITSYFILLAGNLLLFGFICYQMISLLELKDSQRRLLVIITAITFAPVWLIFVLGQLSLLLVLAFLMSYRNLARNQYLRAGLWLSLLLIKPQYLLLPILFLVLHKKFAVLKGFALGTSILLIISFLLVGVRGMQGNFLLFFNTLQWNDAYMVTPALMHTWRAFIQLLLGQEKGLLVNTLWLGGVLVAVALLITIWKEWSKKAANLALQWACLVVGALLISPYANIQDVSLLLVPGILMMKWAIAYQNQGCLPLKTSVLFLVVMYLSALFAGSLIFIIPINFNVIVMFSFLFVIAYIKLRNSSYLS